MEKYLGWLLVALGGAMVMAQTFSDAPWQAGFALGAIAMVVGVGMVMDAAEEDVE